MYGVFGDSPRAERDKRIPAMGAVRAERLERDHGGAGERQQLKDVSACDGRAQIAHVDLHTAANRVVRRCRWCGRDGGW